LAFVPAKPKALSRQVIWFFFVLSPESDHEVMVPPGKLLPEAVPIASIMPTVSSLECVRPLTLFATIIKSVRGEADTVERRRRWSAHMGGGEGAGTRPMLTGVVDGAGE